MREIKFRAWERKRDRMLDWDDLQMEELWAILRGEVDALYVLMQFTGLRDKNGKEIYEGDVVTCYDYKPAKVFFKGGSFMSYIDEHSYLELSQSSFLEDFEVIGNIYENPELLND